jgi:hypothetical protein
MVNLGRRKMSNIYADSIIRDNPSIVWSLDEDLSEVTSLVSLNSLNTPLTTYGTPASYYGSGNRNGYYLGTSTNRATLKSSSFGIPLVYGSSSIISLYENSNNPSFIFPGFGFLNSDGKDKSITLEFWMRVLPDTHYPRRIVGPIASDDGLYVNGPFLSLKLESNVKSHFVGEWGKPMLIQIYYTRNSAGLLINGEQVISILHDRANAGLPSKFSETGKDQDWIGFYAYSNVTPLQIDCIAIYPYQISQKNAKLHFVKGQAVEIPETRNINYTSVPIVIDYQHSKYANNYNYPGAGKWENGVVENLSTQNNILSVPDYKLPSVVFQNSLSTLEQWYTAQSELTGQSTTTSLPDGDTLNDEVFFRMNPMEEDKEWNTNGYIHFKQLNVIQDDIKSIYGVFSVSSLPATEECLLKIVNQNSESFEVSITGNDISYKFISGTSSNIAIKTDVVTTNTKFSVGIALDSLIENNPGLKSFFYDKSSLQMFVAGSESFNKVFSGNVYKIGFCSANNFQKISSQFANGIINHDSTSIRTHYASYTLVGVNTFNDFELDIAINGSWKDYVPAKILAKQISQNSYDLDFIQVNVDYPEIANVTNSFVRSYIEFSDVMSSIISDSQNTKSNQPKSSYQIVEPDNNWVNKKYEFVDSTIVYLPTGGYGSIDDLTIISHLEFFIPGIIRNPVAIKTYQLSAQSLIDATTPVPIGTRYGKDIYSYASGSYSGKNPYTIYKGSTPYLYLTKNSGIKLVGSTFDGTREVRIPINEFGKRFYEVSTIQASIFHEKNFGSSAIEIFRITESTGTIIVKATPNEGGLTANISLEKGGSAYTSADIYINGQKESTAVIRYKEWQMITLQFKQNLNFASSTTFKIAITGPFLINNVSDYQISEVKVNQNVLLNSWSTIKGTSPFEKWNDYDDLKWGGNKESPGVLTSSVLNVPQLDPQLIYNAYIGTNKIIGLNGPKNILTSQSNITGYSSVRSNSIVVTPL